MFKEIQSYFLHRYNESDLLLKEKSLMLYLINLFIIFFVLPALIAYLKFSGNKWDFIFFPLTAYLCITIVLAILRKGHYFLAVQLMLIFLFTTVWAYTFKILDEDRNLYEKLVGLFVNLLISMTIPLILIRRFGIIVLYSGVNIVTLTVYFYLLNQKNILPPGMALNYSIFFSLIFIIINLVSFIIFYSYRRTFDKFSVYEQEIQVQNEELLASNEEFEAMNEELLGSQNELMLSEKRYRGLYDNALAGIISIQEPDGIILKINETGKHMLGYDVKDEIENKLKMTDVYANPEHRERILTHLIQNGKISSVEVQYRKKDNSLIWAEISARLVNPGNRVEAVFTDVTKRKETEESLHRLTFYDQLTSLPNRNMFAGKLKEEIVKSRRKNKENIFAVMYIDIDKFKNINEIHGPLFGDEVLLYTAKKLKNLIRGDDFLSRIERDRFMILFSDIGTTDGIIEIVRKVFELFTVPFPISNTEISISISIGVCLYPHDGATAEELMKNSERALLTAKKDGNATYHLYDAALNERLLNNLRLEFELSNAVHGEEFFCHYQPKLTMDNHIIGMEALIRWKSPVHGIMYPSHFIPLLEKNGLIMEAGRMVLEMSCRQAKQWYDDGFDSLVVAVNISPLQFRQPDLLETIREVLEDTGLDPNLLELEITESSIMQNEDESIEKLQAIRNLGISISIDDFGTGYSSLSKLKDYPINVLKIDKSFIDTIPLDVKSSTIAATVIELAHNLGFKVVAEGIEKQEQLDFLQKNHCDQYQGFLFSKPVPPEEFTELLKKHFRGR
ncbi:MAG: hypothetical protein CVV44_06230 [Spirochaetae bacterium HGW-Spirochaetae-1]|jgi:diguanylate cyclase (GGDEF)-like protein/PAS domain S-box-containing protein|nr:MAG: hypothetical protein CVV44_06230 [Spirochaetae bacterium HGW-Spirochaetae-1]